MPALARRTIGTPAGPLRLLATERALVGAFFPAQLPPPFDAPEAVGPHAVLEAAARELAEYVDGRRTRFSVPLAPAGTDFQRSVWSVLELIPCGETRTYGWVAAQLGRPDAVRAVGSAIGRNPIGIVIPCHRVIGADGTLTGYAGGLDAKRRLLAHEKGASIPGAAGADLRKCV